MFVQDVRDEQRWPGYVQAAHEQDVLGSLSVPVRPPASATAPAETAPGAALHLYARSPGAFGEPASRAAEAIAVLAGAVLTDPDMLPSAASRLAQSFARGGRGPPGLPGARGGLR